MKHKEGDKVRMIFDGSDYYKPGDILPIHIVLGNSYGTHIHKKGEATTTVWFYETDCENTGEASIMLSVAEIMVRDIASPKEPYKCPKCHFSHALGSEVFRVELEFVSEGNTGKIRIEDIRAAIMEANKEIKL